MKKLACCLLLATFGARAAEQPPPEQAWDVRVHLHSDDERVSLLRASGKLVCRAPCDIDLHTAPGEVFKLGGQGIAESQQFTLPERALDAGELTLRARARSSAPQSAGKGLILLGVLAIAGGVILHSTQNTECAGGSSSRCNEAASTGLWAGGGVAALVGICLALGSRGTTLTAD